LKIAIIIDSYLIPSWKLETIKILQKQSFIGLEVLCVNFTNNNTKIKKQPSFSFIEKIYQIISSLERRLFSAIGPDAFLIQSLTANSFEKGINFESIGDLYTYLEKNKTEIVLNLSHNALPSKFNSLSKYGIWEIYSGKTKFSNKFPGLIEVFKYHKVHTLTLYQILKANSEKNIVYQSYSQVEKINLLKNNNKVFWKVPLIIHRKVQEIHREEKNTLKLLENFSIRKQHIFQEVVLILGLLYLVPLRYFQFAIRRLKKKISFNQWILMFNLAPETQKDLNIDFDNFTKIIPPKDRLWADPFVIEKNEEFHIFIEELLFKQGKGFISHFIIDKKGNYTTPKKIIEKEYHMSYPFLFEDNGHLFMIPETNQNKTIELYKCVQFPDTWEFVQNIMENIEAVDTTITFKDNKYWLFTNIREHAGVAFEDELFLYYADSLTSLNWTLHPKSPIKSDVRVARPGGGFCEVGENMLRPSQNSMYHYGYGLNFSKILELTPEAYEEEVIEAIIPDWDPKIVSVHTYNSTGSFTIIDAELKRWKDLKS